MALMHSDFSGWGLPALGNSRWWRCSAPGRTTIRSLNLAPQSLRGPAIGRVPSNQEEPFQTGPPAASSFFFSFRRVVSNLDQAEPSSKLKGSGGSNTDPHSCTRWRGHFLHRAEQFRLEHRARMSRANLGSTQLHFLPTTKM